MTPTRDLGRRARRVPAAGWGLSAAVALVAVSMAVPALTGWNVRVHSFPPLHAEWQPRTGVGTVPAVALAVVLALWAVDLADRLPWRRLLVATFGAGLAWMLALAFVDGSAGVGELLEHRYEYLRTARATTDLHATLQEYVGRIPYSAYPRNWPVHVAGHPPGALLLFVALVRLGLGSGLAAGLVVTVLAATTAAAVMVTVRTLGSELMARRAAPFLAFGPAAVWQSVSADAVFAAVAAWGIACLAVAATRRSVAWSILAGLLLGYVVMMSYGLPLLGVLALAALATARSWLPLPIAAVAALAVVLTFAALGFSYLEALPAIRERYWEGVGGRRPESYWLWGSLGALVLSAGPMVGAGLAHLMAGLRGRRPDGERRVVALLAGAGVAMVVLADLSLMSKAEVERIWLPFVPWLLLSCALLPERWRRGGMVLQVMSALVVQHLLFTGW